MGEPKIPGGYYIKARIIKQKKIAHCAPCVREIWDYLLREVTFSEYGSLKKGQLFIRYQEIIEDLKWFVGYRKMTYSMDQTKKAMKVLRDLSMITTTKARGGVLVTLLNYEFYNDLNNYESTNEGTNESTNESTNVPPTINKNGKELKKKKTNIQQNEFAEDINGEIYTTKKGRQLKGKRLDSFLMFWDSFNYKKDKANAADSWLDIPELTNALVNEICEAAKIEAESRPDKIKNGQIPKMAQGWISARRWEDEHKTMQKTKYDYL